MKNGGICVVADIDDDADDDDADDKDGDDDCISWPRVMIIREANMMN